MCSKARSGRWATAFRITAQLVDASTDSHLWSETYDRELTTRNIFEVQSDIAEAIAGKLRATLSQQDLPEKCAHLEPGSVPVVFAGQTTID